MIDESKWRFVLCKLDGTAPANSGAGRVMNASGRQFSYHKNASRTAQFVVDIDNPRADFALSQDCLMKVYRKNRLGTWVRLLVGDVISVEETSQGDSGVVTVVASDAFWRVQRRFLGVTSDSKGRGVGVSVGTAASPVDIGTIYIVLLAVLNGDFYTGISSGTLQTSTNSYIGPVYAQNAAELFQQLASILGAPDFELAPIEPTTVSSGVQIATMNIYASLGTLKPNCIFEYGTGKNNVQVYDRLVSKDGLCNSAYSLPPGWPGVPARGDSVQAYADLASMAARGFFQDVVPNDLTTTSARQELVTETVQVRSTPRTVISMTPTADNPLDFTVDYNVGDTVVARAKVNNKLRFNGTCRLYGVDLTVDDNDSETPALVLVPGG